MTAKLFDLTRTNLRLEMYRNEFDPLADPTFRRHVETATTQEGRADTTERLMRLREAHRRAA